MKRATVPVTMGSAWCRSMEAPLYVVTEAYFPPGSLLHPHTHDRAVFGVMLRGSFETRIGARSLACDQSSSWVEPREEKHANAVGTGGAWVIVIQPESGRDEFESLAGFLDSIHVERNPEVVLHARRIAAEMTSQDALSTLGIESAVLGMLASAARLSMIRERMRKAPAWLRQARDIIHETFRNAPGLAEIARSVGVPPTQLAHSFRHFYGATVGSYTRELRLTWALDRIVSSADALAGVAAQAGFADQSHMNRECKARTGFTPRQLRLRGR